MRQRSPLVKPPRPKASAGLLLGRSFLRFLGFEADAHRLGARGRFLGWLTSNAYEPLVAPLAPPPPPPPLPPAARFVATKPVGGTFQGVFNAAPGLPRPAPVRPLDPATPRPVRPRPQKPPVAAAPSQLPLWTNSGNLQSANLRAKRKTILPIR